MTAVLGQVQVYVSGIGFLIQMFLTTRIQRFLGVGFALMLLPLGFGVMAVIILLNAALWAPMFARVMDKSLRYTVDKTSREILFLPLPDAIKNKAKPFVDVTADRFARALQGLVVLILIAPWGLGLDWQQVSYASLVIMAGWIGMVVVAKRALRERFPRDPRRATTSRGRRPAACSGPRRDRDARRGARPPGRTEGAHRYRSARVAGKAESRHASPPQSSVLAAFARGRSWRCDPRGRNSRDRQAATVERLLADPDGEVRAAAVAALTHIRDMEVADLVRPLLSSTDPRIVVTAALALAGTGREHDRSEGERALQRLARQRRAAQAADGRRELAAAIRQFGGVRLHYLLVPLIS